MSKRAMKKLSSTKGTSIFFGLLLFLAASVLSTVILQASVTAVKRVESDRTAEQNYLTCSSAAKMLRDGVLNTRIIKTTTVTEEKSTGSSSSQTVWEQEAVQSGNLELGTLLKEYLQQLALPEAAGTGAELTRKWTVTVGTSGSENADALEDVNVTFTIRPGKNHGGENETPGYDIAAVLETGEDADFCQMSLTLRGKDSSAAPVVNETETSRITKKVSTYTWEAKDIIFGTGERSGEAVE